jgi:predicted aspartyl protease
MKPIRYFGACFTSFAFAFVCLSSRTSNAWADSSEPLLPDPLRMERTNLAEGPIIVKLRIEDGEELPVKLDTGATVTFLDESLVSKLGRRLGTTNCGFPFGNPNNDNEETTSLCNYYSAPKLYVGDRPLLTGPLVITGRSHAPTVKGTLGMDCLRHYCIQFDFVAGKVIFLDPENLDPSELGTPLALRSGHGNITYFEGDPFAQGKMRFMLDTGFDGPYDAMIDPKVFKRLAQKYPNNVIEFVVPAGISSGNIFPKLNFCGQTYTDLNFYTAGLSGMHVKGVIGMRFLARHRVTLNYPKHIMYLKYITGAPLAGGSATSDKKSLQATGATPSVFGGAGNAH